MKPGSQFVFVDESGRPESYNRLGTDLVATGKTTNHLVIAAVRTTEPDLLARTVAAVAPRPEGGQPRVLHAAGDPRSVRFRVLTALAGLDVIATVTVMDKRLMREGSTWRRDSIRFYNDMLAFTVADQIQIRPMTTITLSRKDYDSGEQVLTMFNAISDRHRVILGRMAKVQPHELFVSQKRHSSSRGLQAADYVAYAVFQAFERGDMQYYEILQPILGRVWDIGRFQQFTRRSPMKNPP